MAVSIAFVVAVARNGVIGRDGDLPWRIPDDLRHFKALTMGKPIVMGRKTYESIGRALPGRVNIVVTRTPGYTAEGIVVATDMTAAFALAERAAAAAAVDEIMVIGGAAIYAAALAQARRIYLTEVHAEIDGDVYFPRLPPQEWREAARVDHAAADTQPAFSFVTLERQGV